jgi:hypothetical protein
VVIKVDRRFSTGLTFQWNYAFSKMLSDTDDFNTAGATSQDQYNRRLEKSLSGFDQTHALKLSTIYALPFGRGRRWMRSSRLMDAFLGGWRLAALQSYASGFPLALTRSNPFPIFNGATRPTITSYDNWRAPTKGANFDPAADLFLNPAVFPTQPLAFGNDTRFNPKMRALPAFNENASLGKTFAFRESMRLDFRCEAFNIFNRVLFAAPSTNLSSSSFGVITTQANVPRQMQLGLKFYW